MGHERVGRLPKTQKWQTIVHQIGRSKDVNVDVENIAKLTIKSVRSRFQNLQNDEGTQAAFAFLVSFAYSSKSLDSLLESQLFNSIDIANGITPLTIGKAIRQFTAATNGKSEYTSIAEKAATDAIVTWYASNKNDQESFFTQKNDQNKIWEKASVGSGFCEISRLYFSKIVERYLNYFLERELHQTLSSVNDSKEFSKGIENYFDNISRHAFETSKITQSYSAGWFNKYAQKSIPSEEEIKKFVSYAFGKLQDELAREEK